MAEHAGVVLHEAGRGGLVAEQAGGLRLRQQALRAVGREHVALCLCGGHRRLRHQRARLRVQDHHLGAELRRHRVVLDATAHALGVRCNERGASGGPMVGRRRVVGVNGAGMSKP